MEVDFSIYISDEEAEAIALLIESAADSFEKDQIIIVEQMKAALPAQVQKNINLDKAIKNFQNRLLSYNNTFSTINQLVSTQINSIDLSKFSNDFDEINYLLGLKDIKKKIENGYRMLATALSAIPEELSEDVKIKIISCLGFRQADDLLSTIRGKDVDEIIDIISDWDIETFQDGSEEERRAIIILCSLLNMLVIQETGSLEEKDYWREIYCISLLHDKFNTLYNKIKNSLFKRKDFNYPGLTCYAKTSSDLKIKVLLIFAEYYVLYENSSISIGKPFYEQIKEKLGLSHIILNESEDRFLLYDFYHDYCQRNGLEELWQPADLDEKPLEKKEEPQLGVDIPIKLPERTSTTVDLFFQDSIFMGSSSDVIKESLDENTRKSAARTLFHKKKEYDGVLSESYYDSIMNTANGLADETNINAFIYLLLCSDCFDVKELLKILLPQIKEIINYYSGIKTANNIWKRYWESKKDSVIILENNLVKLEQKDKRWEYIKDIGTVIFNAMFNKDFCPTTLSHHTSKSTVYRQMIKFILSDARAFDFYERYFKDEDKDYKTALEYWIEHGSKHIKGQATILLQALA